MGFIVRGVVFTPRPLGGVEARVEAVGLQKWLGGGGEGVTVYHSLVVQSEQFLAAQSPPEPRPRLYRFPVALRIRGVGKRICRYHEGPDGRIEEHVYCLKPAVTQQGYCRDHAKSVQALFEKCAASDIEACSIVDTAWRGESYTVYALDYGGDRLKIGLTRSWRLLWRIAEQPHVSAAVIKTTGSLVEARGYEREMGSRRTAGEGGGVRILDRLLSSTALLRSLDQRGLAERLASMLHALGVKGRVEAYTVLPRGDPAAYVKAKTVRGIDELVGQEMLIEDYWAGLLYARTEGGPVVVPKKTLQHILLYGEIREYRGGARG